MQLGFNTNFRYRDVVFHVQTEDSGRANPHVITHIFHGGNIIASLKSDYSDLLVEADLEAPVRKLMESQHKAMLKQLSRGEFDRAIGERLGPEIFRAGAGAEVEGPAAGGASGPGAAAVGAVAAGAVAAGAGIAAAAEGAGPEASGAVISGAVASGGVVSTTGRSNHTSKTSRSRSSRAVGRASTTAKVAAGLRSTRVTSATG